MQRRRGPATVLGSKPIICHWDENLGKVWASYDPEPGELPVRQSPFLPTRDGEGILTQQEYLAVSNSSSYFEGLYFFYEGSEG